MRKKVLVVDTCLACVWQKVPGMETAGSDENRWDFERVDEKINTEIEKGTLLVLPLASFIETGNHITQIKAQDRKPYVEKFGKMIVESIDGQSPWATYGSQNKLWEGGHLREVVNRWIEMNKIGKHSFGDVSILDVATAYRYADYDVEILTADELLKAYESVDLDVIDVPVQPRRRTRK